MSASARRIPPFLIMRFVPLDLMGMAAAGSGCVRAPRLCSLLLISQLTWAEWPPARQGPKLAPPPAPSTQSAPRSLPHTRASTAAMCRMRSTTRLE